MTLINHLFRLNDSEQYINVIIINIILEKKILKTFIKKNLNNLHIIVKYILCKNFNILNTYMFFDITIKTPKL